MCLLVDRLDYNDKAYKLRKLPVMVIAVQAPFADRKRPIYLDYAATTPVDPLVAESMSRCLTMDGHYGNPSSRGHQYGWQAEEYVEAARQQLAELVNCDPRELIWTSGATEANNLAIKGLLEANPQKGRHLITSAIEHMAVLDTMDYMSLHGRYEVTQLQPNAAGLIKPDQVRAALRPDTALVSLMHVNNETGAVNPIAHIGKIVQAAGVPLHVDAAQGLGKLPLDLCSLPVDLMSFSGHKIYGPKGVGALYRCYGSDFHVAAQIHGGGHEQNMRSGTLATHQLVGMGLAAQLCGSSEQINAEFERMGSLRKIFLQELTGCGQFSVNGDGYPGILNITFPTVDGESLLMALAPDIAASSGSACNSIKVEPSHVLLAMGLDKRRAHNSIRVSFGRFTSMDEVAIAARRINTVVAALS